LRNRIGECRASLEDERLVTLGGRAAGAIDNVEAWLQRNSDSQRMQAGARRIAMTLGRAWQLALLCEQGQWSSTNDNDRSGIVAATRFAATPIDVLPEFDPVETALL
jgi:hypothetical protein